MSKYTPGPWLVVFGTIQDSKGKELLHQSQMFKNDRTAGEVEANAQLIAAAPDLLEACKEASKLINDGNNRVDCLSAVVILKKVIAKAEEES